LKPDLDEPAASAPEDATPDHDDTPGEPVPAFDPRRFDRQLQVDAWLRALLLMAVIVVLFATAFVGADNTLMSAVAILLVIGTWIAVSVINARVSQQLPAVTAMIDAGDPEAEPRLAALLRRRALFRWVRLLLYHRVAMLRHRQHNPAEAAAVCAAVLGQPLGPARQVAASLNLIDADARLTLGDLQGTYAAIARLHQQKLSLQEALQRMALQTRYEVAAGLDEQTIDGLRRKLAMIDLLPASQCGEVHATLAVAAHRAGRAETARWLAARAVLLCQPEQLTSLRNDPAHAAALDLAETPGG